MIPAPQFKLALLAAKEPLLAMPRNPKALTLMGLVLSHSGTHTLTPARVCACVCMCMRMCMCI